MADYRTTGIGNVSYEDLALFNQIFTLTSPPNGSNTPGAVQGNRAVNTTDNTWYVFNNGQWVEGPRGLSAYEIAVANGYSGSQADWEKSLIGPRGPQGEQGIQGPAGIGLVNKSEWVSGTTYTQDNYVFATSSHNSSVNSLYVLLDTTPYTSTIPPAQDPQHWSELEAPQGPQGIQGPPGVDGKSFPNDGTEGLNSSTIKSDKGIIASDGMGNLSVATLNVGGAIKADNGSLFSDGAGNLNLRTATFTNSAGTITFNGVVNQLPVSGKAALPTAAGQGTSNPLITAKVGMMVFVTDALKTGEAAGQGTGSICVWDSKGWFNLATSNYLV